MRDIADLTLNLPQYDIVPAVEERLGFALPSHTITVYVPAYSEPHDIRLTGLRFVTNVSYPFDIVLHSAIHETMHPPYRLDDPDVRRAVMQLSAEPVIVDKVTHHDRSAGYNTATGLIEEDSVEALEQIVSKTFGAGRYARWSWYNQLQGSRLRSTIRRFFFYLHGAG